MNVISVPDDVLLIEVDGSSEVSTQINVLDENPIHKFHPARLLIIVSIVHCCVSFLVISQILKYVQCTEYCT